tara:strand:+ start:4834 stop:5496 length:663 start_codon:yes stop_codon:yes gene_type:complete
MSSRNNYIEETLYEYILSTSLRDTPLQARLRDETANMPSGIMQISPDQGQFMALLVKLTGATKILEVGSFTGYSALVMAQALPNSGKLIACDISKEYTLIAQRYWKEAGVSDRIDLRIGSAVETLSDLIQKDSADTFDMAFIDADKVNYRSYYESCLALLRPGGLLMIDNVLWNGRPAHKEETDEDTVAIRNLNRSLHHDERIDVSLLSIGDGLTLARKR